MGDNSDNSDKYSYILESRNPDKHIEYFWYYFKISIYNFYNYTKVGHYLAREIKYQSKLLNSFQQNKQYQDIEIHISNFIYKCLFVMVKNRANFHHYSILLTNIKRWNKICDINNRVEIKDNQDDQNGYDSQDDQDDKDNQIIQNEKRLKNQILIFSYIYNKMKYKYGSIYDKLLLIKDNDCDYNYHILCEMLAISVENKYCAFIDMISNDVDIYEFINREYDTCFVAPIGAIKIIRQMVKLNLI